MITAGIDGGSRAVKAAVLDDGRVVGTAIADQGVAHDELAERVFSEALAAAGLDRGAVAGVVATGYARNRITFADRTITEISCHARGVRHVVPDSRTIVEIGGQDSKLIKLDVTGAVQDFSMNDRCAAGTGRFLEMVAQKLETSLDSLGDLAKGCDCPASISSMCVVFAETEIIGLLADGARREDIVAGVQESLARRVAGMAGRSLVGPVVFTGGVALVPGMREAIESHLGEPVDGCPDPVMTGAIGAAILARPTE